MIDSVYKSVQIILNKNSYGYISPADFNQHALNAQLEIFQNYFADFNKQTNLENVRRSGTGLADISKKIAESIETFSVTNLLNVSSGNIFSLPSLATTGDIAYMIGKILISTQLYSGTNTTLAGPNVLIDSGANFSSAKPGDVVLNTTENTLARVVSVVSATTISLTANIFQDIPRNYKVLSVQLAKEAEKISHSKSTLLNSSLLTSPSITFPAYTQEGSLITLFPSTINTKGQVIAQYYKYPKNPKWTYVSLTGGSPSFDQSAADYQDFQISADEEVELVIKICQYAGVEIREREVVEFAKREQMENDQPKM